jgi:predicted thioesterase
MTSIPVGTHAEHTELVTSQIAIDFLGNESARVLGTPWLVMLLEMTSRNAIQPLLEAGYDSVGSEVCVKHLAATPMGMTVTFRAEVIEVADRRVRFRVEAFDEKEKVAEGTHERFVIHVDRFASRIVAKRAAS